MIPRVDPRVLATLYEGAPKVMLLDTSAASRGRFSEDEGFRWLFARAGRDGGLIVGDVEADLSATIDLCPLEIPPANVLAVWAPQAKDVSLAESLMSWWRQTGGEAAVPAMVHGGRADLDKVLLARALHQTDSLARANERLMRDLAALREVWENHGRIPPEIEELMRALRFASPRLIFGSPISDDDYAVPTASGPGPAPKAASLRQRLPTSARGFLGVDVGITYPGLGEGLLQVELIALDAGATLARWQVPFATLCAGWLPLRLQRVSALPWRSLELRVSAIGAAGSAPRLAAGPVGLLWEYALALPDSDGPGHAVTRRQMLSLRLWGGLPGMSYDGDAVESGTLPADPIVPVPDATLAAVRLTRELKATFPCFGYLERGKILLRPLRTQPSAAALTLPPTPGLIAVSCDAVIDNAQCQTTQLGARLVVMPTGHGADEAERGDHALASSEWIELNAPLQPQRLVARLTTPHNIPVDLHLFTRLPTGGLINHARIVFERFEAEIHAMAAWKMTPVLPSGPSLQEA